jgi:glutamyl-tRNA reductase
MNTIFSAHITHKQAKLSEIEKLGQKAPEDLLRMMCRLPGVKECAVLSTCNRVEIYTVTDDMEATWQAMAVLIDGMMPFDANANLVLYMNGKESVGHILRVASGLESLILGEDQIQGQVKAAYELAVQEGTMGTVLSIVFRKAISVGKKVRTETKVNKGAVSVGSAAVELAEARLGDLSDRNILVIGAGEVATLIARHLAGKGPKAVFVSNRTYSKAVELAWTLNGRAVRYDNLVNYAALSDVVLCATSATHMILTREHVEAALRQRPEGKGVMIVIDVSFPRNVEPEVGAIPGVELYDIDGLRGKAEENYLRRRDEVRSAERIVAAELDGLGERIREMHADELISQLYVRFNSLKEREVRKALNRLAAGTEPAEDVLNDFAGSMINKLLADPTKMLKEASRDGDVQTLSLVGEMFRMEGNADVPDKPSPKIAH